MALDIASIFSICVLVEAIWLILPAYAANGLAALAGKKKNLHPVDGGRSFLGKRLFGDGKSWEGLVLGTLVGVLIALVELLAFPYLPWELSPVPLVIVPMSLYLGFLLGFGSMAGDLAGSFIKRRFGIGRGRPAPLLDQEDFLLGALLFASLAITIKIEWAILLLVVTPLIHWFANYIGYLLHIKRTPW